MSNPEIGEANNISKKNDTSSGAWPALKLLVVAWLIFVFTFGVFPLWAAAMHIGLQDWDALACFYWFKLSVTQSLAWTAMVPNFAYYVLHAAAEYRPTETLWEYVQFILAHGQWWGFYLAEILEILACGWVLYAIASYFECEFLGIAALFSAFFMSNKPQVWDILDRSYFETAAVLLVFYCLLRLTNVAAAYKRGIVWRHIGYAFFAILIVCTTFAREYMIAFTLTVIMFVHLYAIVRREPILHAYMLLPWAAQTWLFYRLLIFSHDRQVKMDWGQFGTRIVEFCAKLFPMRLDGDLSVWLAAIFIAGVIIAILVGLHRVIPWLMRRDQDTAPIILIVMTVGAMGMLLLDAIPNPMPTWSRYIVASATLLTAVAVIGLGKVRSGFLRRFSFVTIAFLTPLLALPDRYHNQAMTVHYMWSFNNLLHRIADLQKNGAQVAIDAGPTFAPENAYSIESFFRLDANRFYGLPTKPILTEDAIRRDKVGDFYLIFKDRDAFDFRSIEKTFPTYSVASVEGFISDAPLGLDSLGGFWDRSGRSLGQKGDLQNDFFWDDIARNPGYYLLHIVKGATRGFVGLEQINVPLSASAAALSAKFKVKASGWYFICAAPSVKAESGAAYLMLQSAKGSVLLEPIGSATQKAIIALPFYLGGSDPVQVVATGGPKIKVEGAPLSICPLRVTSPILEFGSLF